MAGLKLFIDEDLSPALVREGQACGCDSTCCRDRGLLGEPDHVLLARCIAEDRVLVTNNVGDFRRLCAREEVHPGLVVLPLGGLTRQRESLRAAIDHAGTRAAEESCSTVDFFVNRVVEVDELGLAKDFELP